MQHICNKYKQSAEAGFSLIELLIVMIIMAILTSIAIPTFMAQKATAKKTAITKNIHNIWLALESCSANNPNGLYNEARSGGIDCTDGSVLAGYDPGLKGMNFYEQAFKVDIKDLNLVLPINLETDTYYVIDIGDNQILTAAGFKEGDNYIIFAEQHISTGTVYRVCGSIPNTDNNEITMGEAFQTYIGKVKGSKTCTTGVWGEGTKFEGTVQKAIAEAP